ncbi:hypothetical protein V6R21_29375 [Limibacter armeniacum]|uniref:hypothetical protein n=1 Tax=Limibacter armeniacum TaxID=466084 RepID=UPI002FE56C66
MNDAWYQVIYQLQEYFTVWAVLLGASVISMLVFLIYNPKKKFQTEEDRMQYLFNELKVSKANADKIMEVYEQRLEDKELEIKQRERRLKSIEEQIAAQESDLLYVTDLPEDLQGRIVTAKRRTNYKMLLLGILFGGLVGVILMLLILNQDTLMSWF